MNNISFLLLMLLLVMLGSCDFLSDDIPGSGYPNIISSDTSKVPASLIVQYKADAARLALRVLNDDGNDQEVEIPNYLLNTIYNAFIHFYNLSGNPTRDSVVMIYKICAFPTPETHSLIVAVDSSKEWVRYWKRGERFTGNEKIDSLLTLYDLYLKEYYIWPSMSSHVVVLKSTKPLNINALAKRFGGINGVVYAHANGTCCDGNDIKAEPKSTYWQFEYSVGYGDCPSGCISRRFWTFHIFTDGRIEYKGSSGSPPPRPGEDF
ncbi:MAG: hypothetical protein HYZ34_08200 [Ignavibacteriae bacterium]|nr:hypothetical protein [Ignavibacteriota bacterium]